MELKPWKLEFIPDWDAHFKKFDKSVKEQILKKLNQMKQPLQARGLHSSKYQVEETGQYRIAIKTDSENRIKKIQFIGTHKQYEKWYKNQ
ncbi:MAG: hypothetical protein NUV57_02515 [archaeon]|nr:hypothetical protein [archaeon]